jgi:hypothetical protein
VVGTALQQWPSCFLPLASRDADGDGHEPVAPNAGHYARRQLLAKAAIAASRVGSKPCVGGAARSVDKPRFIPIIVPTAGRGHWDVTRPGVEFSEKEKTLPVQG